MTKPRPAPVPQTRLGRLARIGFAAGELAVGAATQGIRRLASGQAPDFAGALLSGASAQRLAARLARLRGAAMKLGQLVSLHGDDVLPPEFAEALAVLRAQAAPMPAEQVHRATARDGRELALKIQYPGVARSIASDVDNVAVLLRLFNILPLGIDIAGTAEEAKRQLSQEADYEAEGRLLESYAKLVADEPKLLVPRVHWDLTTARVMAMDYMEGEPLESVRPEAPATRNAVGTLLERLLFRELFEFRVMQTDPNFAKREKARASRGCGAFPSARGARRPAFRHRADPSRARAPAIPGP